MIVLLWIINFVISIVNAWGCGKSWNETRAIGGFPKLLNWCGAIMSAIGFTWCYMIIIGTLGYTIPIEHTVNGHTVTAPYLLEKDVQFLFDIGYLALIVPLLGAGAVITVNSWRKYKESRSLVDGIELGWNSFAMANNIYHAAADSGGVFGRVSSYKSDDAKEIVVLWLFLVCLFGGVMTTYLIIRSVSRSTAIERSFRYENY